MARNALFRNQAIALLGLIGAAGALVGCEKEEITPPGGGGTNRVQCYPMSAAAQSSGLTHVWLPPDHYGANFFYIWKVDVGGTSSAPVYTYSGTSTKVVDYVPSEGWSIPTTLWSAARAGLDGYDPYKFSETDPFVVGYLPALPVTTSPWTSKTGAKNTGTCPNNNTTINGRPRCAGKDNRAELDLQSPTLVSGKTYLVRLVMGFFIAGSMRVQNCSQVIISH